MGAPGLAMGASGLLGVPDRGPGVLMGAPGPAPGPAPGYYARAEHVFWVPLAAHSVGRKERAKRDEWLDAGRRGKSPRTLDRAGKARARVSALEGLWMALKKRRRCSCHCLVEREMKRPDMLSPFGHDKDSDRKELYGNRGRVIRESQPEPEPEPPPLPPPR